MIGIVNYGLGNIHAIANIYKRLNIPAVIASEPKQLYEADRLILPGVGSFDWAMTRLNHSGMKAVLDELVLHKKKPILGICVGMQMMGRRSEEGKLDGLNWIQGEVKRFENVNPNMVLHLPHMGWNDVNPSSDKDLFRNLNDNARFYFLHSYYFLPSHQSSTLAITDYHGVFASSIQAENIYGVQFHPEKSHQWGIQLLKNFGEF